MSRAAPHIAFHVLVALAIVIGCEVSAYLKLGTRISTGIVQVKWEPGQMPIRYLVTNRDVPGVSAMQLQAALERAFSAWTGVPTASLSARFDGFTGAEPDAGENRSDGLSVIGFRSRPDLDRVLGSTSFKIDETTGQLIESDIFLNSTVSWSVAPTGEPSRYDVESIAVHEVGHLLGLGHSALGETDQQGGGRLVRGKRAVMFPIAYPPGNIEDRTLEADDVAGISDVYPAAGFAGNTGVISGRVTRSGTGIFGAHIMAFNLDNGTITGGFSLSATGEFVVGGLVPGLYVVRAEPLDDADVNLFFDEEIAVPIDFRPAYFEKIVAVPAGGSSGAIEIRVQPK
jgi:hypothetical protein